MILLVLLIVVAIFWRPILMLACLALEGIRILGTIIYKLAMPHKITIDKDELLKNLKVNKED